MALIAPGDTELRINDELNSLPLFTPEISAGAVGIGKLLSCIGTTVDT